jgi:hypothetical protein
MTFGTPPTSTATRVNNGFAEAAATPPSPAVNFRRRIRHLLSPHCAQPIAAGNAWERVNTEECCDCSTSIWERSEEKRTRSCHARNEAIDPKETLAVMRECVSPVYSFVASGFTISRAQLMNSCAAGFSVRFFKVTIPTGLGVTGKSTGRTLNDERMAPKCMNDSGRYAR